MFEGLGACAAAVPVGTVAPPAQRPEASVARVMESAAGFVAKGAVAVGEQVKARRNAPQ